tara:strand:+ start:941 stop:1360 length:420 start_codon:yes stop_codon:yes gene_type:complete
MKNLLLTLAAIVVFAFSSSAQKLVEVTETATGDSLVLLETTIFKITNISGTSSVVEYLSERGKEVIPVNETMYTLKDSATAKQFVIYNDSAAMINKAFIVSGVNKNGDTTSTIIYQYDGAPKYTIDLDFSIDSLKSLTN